MLLPTVRQSFGTNKSTKKNWDSFFIFSHVSFSNFNQIESIKTCVSYDFTHSLGGEWNKERSREADCVKMTLSFYYCAVKRQNWQADEKKRDASFSLCSMNWVFWFDHLIWWAHDVSIMFYTVNNNRPSHMFAVSGCGKFYCWRKCNFSIKMKMTVEESL